MTQGHVIKLKSLSTTYEAVKWISGNVTSMREFTGCRGWTPASLMPDFVEHLTASGEEFDPYIVFDDEDRPLWIKKGDYVAKHPRTGHLFRIKSSEIGDMYDEVPS